MKKKRIMPNPVALEEFGRMVCDGIDRAVKMVKRMHPEYTEEEAAMYGEAAYWMAEFNATIEFE